MPNNDDNDVLTITTVDGQEVQVLFSVLKKVVANHTRIHVEHTPQFKVGDKVYLARIPDNRSGDPFKPKAEDLVKEGIVTKVWATTQDASPLTAVKYWVKIAKEGSVISPQAQTFATYNEALASVQSFIVSKNWGEAIIRCMEGSHSRLMFERNRGRVSSIRANGQPPYWCRSIDDLNIPSGEEVYDVLTPLATATRPASTVCGIITKSGRMLIRGAVEKEVFSIDEFEHTVLDTTYTRTEKDVINSMLEENFKPQDEE